MEADGLDREIEAFRALLPGIKERYGSVWAVVADLKLVKTFPVFSEAAQYAREHFGKQPVLIRHTDETKVEFAPFVLVHAET